MTTTMWHVILCAAIAAPLALGRTRDVAWQDLDRYIGGKRVAIELPDGVRVEGKAMSVAGESLMIDIRKSTDTALHPKGLASIPRSSISEVAVRRGKKLWQILGATAGGALGAAVCGVSVLYMAESGGKMAGVCALAVGGSAGLGYAAGSIGPSTNRIRVLP